MAIDENLVYESIGQKIKKLRAEKGLTQEKLAIGIGVSRVSLANYESGKQYIYISDLYKVAEYFELQITDLLPSIENIKAKSTPSKVVEQDDELTKQVKEEIIKFIEEDHLK